MKTLTAYTLESVFDLPASSISEKAVDVIELTDEELEKATGSCFGWGGFGGCCFPIFSCCCFPFFGGFGGWGGFGGFGGFGGWGW